MFYGDCRLYRNYSRMVGFFLSFYQSYDLLCGILIHPVYVYSAVKSLIHVVYSAVKSLIHVVYSEVNDLLHVACIVGAALPRKTSTVC